VVETLLLLGMAFGLYYTMDLECTIPVAVWVYLQESVLRYARAVPEEVLDVVDRHQAHLLLYHACKQAEKSQIT
jgi:hypothetical protein